MADYIITAAVPVTITALSQSQADRIDALAERADSMRVVDAATHLEGSTLCDQLASAEKELEAQRKEVKAPALAVCDQIDAIAKPYRDALNAARKKLSTAVAIWQMSENERIARENRESVERARAEERRLLKLAEEDRCPVADDFAKPVAVMVVAPALQPTVTSSVAVRMVPQLLVDDASLIPRELHGVTLMVPDESAILELLKRKKVVPGCRMEQVPQVRAKGGRG